MPPLTELTPTQLRKKLTQVEQALDAESPLYAELRLIERLLGAQEAGGTPVYSGITSIIEAIELCLQAHDRGMTRTELLEALTAGGFPLKPTTGRTLITNTLGYHVKSGRLQRRDDLFGLSVWGLNKFV